MNVQKIKSRSARVLFIVGVIAMIAGALDPLEGSVVILFGSGFIAIGTWLGNRSKGLVIYRACLFGLVALGIVAMFILSVLGGIGGKSGHSMWWGLALLPYPLGWLLGIASLIAQMIERLRHRHAA
ncbi:MAG TPA: hypothetical protein VFY06_11310 [Verrucomicrobiae bacterium]|nr:hypothetical protein [Verrucomicrobiae bacterium]